MRKETHEKKSVRFASDGDGRVKITLHVVERYENPDLWWNKADMRRIRKRCRAVVLKVREHSKDYADLVLQTLKRYDKEGDSTDCREDEKKECLQTLIRNYEARGLESHIVEYTSELCERHSKTVFEAARHDGLKDEALRSVSLRTSRGSRCFALRLAECDRLKVQLAEARVNSQCSSKKKSDSETKKAQELGRKKTYRRRRSIRVNNGTVPGLRESSASESSDEWKKAWFNTSISSLDSELSSDTTPVRPKRGKCVRFSNKRDGELDVDIHEYEKYHCPDIWWSAKEITRIREDSRVVVLRNQMRNNDYIEAITKAIERQTEVSTEKLSAAEEKLQDRKLLQQLVLNEDARGLEQHIVEYTQTLAYHHVSTVVEVAREIKAEGQGDPTNILRQVSEKLSRPASFLAERLAACDALNSKQEHATMQGSLLRIGQRSLSLVPPKSSRRCSLPKKSKTAVGSTLDEFAEASDVVILAALKQAPSSTVRNLLWRHSNMDTYPDALLPDDGDITHDARLVKSLPCHLREGNGRFQRLANSLSAPKLIHFARKRARDLEAEKRTCLPKKQNTLVRFAEVSGGRVKVQIRHIEKNNDPSLWWTSTELSNIRQECSSVVQQHVRASSSNFLSSLAKILGDESNRSQPDSRRLLQDLMLNYDARGLERHLLPQMREQSRRHVQNVVEKSRRLRNTENNNSTDVPLLIQECSLRLGQASSVLALKLAQCDRLKSQQGFAEKQECFRWTSNERKQSSDSAPRITPRQKSYMESNPQRSSLEDDKGSTASVNPRSHLEITNYHVNEIIECDNGKSAEDRGPKLPQRSWAIAA